MGAEETSRMDADPKGSPPRGTGGPPEVLGTNPGATPGRAWRGGAEGGGTDPKLLELSHLSLSRGFGVPAGFVDPIPWDFLLFSRLSFPSGSTGNFPLSPVAFFSPLPNFFFGGGKFEPKGSLREVPPGWWDRIPLEFWGDRGAEGGWRAAPADIWGAGAEGGTAPELPRQILWELSGKKGEILPWRGYRQG